MCARAHLVTVSLLTGTCHSPAVCLELISLLPEPCSIHLSARGKVTGQGLGQRSSTTPVLVAQPQASDTPACAELLGHLPIYYLDTAVAFPSSCY